MPNKKPDWYVQAGKEPFKQNHFHGSLSAGVKSRIEERRQAPSRTRWVLGGAAAAVVIAVVAISGILSNGGWEHTLPSNQTPAAQTEGPSPTNPTPSPVVVGTSASCDTPPQQLQIEGKKYQLKSGEASGQPAMKLAYFKCDKGTFTLGDAEDPYSVSYAGDPAKNNSEILVMGNWGGTGTWGQASYSLVTPQTSPSTDTVYTNTQYGFQFSLPESWKGYSIINGDWEGLAMDGDRGEKVVETGPMISIRDPEWTAQTPRQDIPIMVFTLSQWDSLQQGAFHIGAAPVRPSELGRNDTYVFALPARYNSAFPAGYEDVEKILENKPLKALK